MQATLPQLAQMTVLPSIIQSQLVSAQQSQNAASVLLTPQLSLSSSQVPLGSASYHASVSPSQTVGSASYHASVSPKSEAKRS